MRFKNSKMIPLVCALFIHAVLGSGSLLAETVTPSEDQMSSAEGDAIIVIPNVRRPAEGLIVGGQPTFAALGEAARYGYSTIIDLRGVDEDRGFDEATLVEELGMKYVPIPIAGESDFSESNANALEKALAAAEQSDGLVMIHCASGNRVGSLFALRAFFVDGATVEEALSIGVEAGMRDGMKERTRSLLLRQEP